ncbi:MAG: hypothetical protein WD757_07930 [Actinomycetota bacterium]
MIAHATGIDDVLIAAAIVGLFLLYSSRRRKRQAGPAARRTGKCLYCGGALGAGVARCPECGFRTPKG